MKPLKKAFHLQTRRGRGTKEKSMLIWAGWGRGYTALFCGGGDTNYHPPSVFLPKTYFPGCVDAGDRNGKILW